jgi:hypothetical protein
MTSFQSCHIKLNVRGDHHQDLRFNKLKTKKIFLIDIKLGVGQRTDVIVEGLADATGSYFLRSQSPAKPCADTIQPNATAIIYYQNEYLPEPDPWPAFTDAVEVCANVCLSHFQILHHPF